MYRYKDKVKNMALKLSWGVIFVVIFAVVSWGEDFQNYIGKTEQQLSGFTSGSNTITDPTYWYDQVYAPIRAAIQRINRNRCAADYASNIQAAIDSGGVVTFLAQDTITVTSSVAMASNMVLVGNGESSVIASVKGSIDALPIVRCEDDSDIIIKGIHFKPDTTDEYIVEHDHCIGIKRCKRVFITECVFDAVGDGIALEHDLDGIANTEIYIVNNIFRGARYEAINWPHPVSRNGVSVIHGRNIVIANNIFEGFAGPGCIDVEPNRGFLDYAHDVLISGNIIRTATNGIIVSCNEDNNSTRRINIVDNHISYIGYTYVDAYPGYGIYYTDYGYADAPNYNIRGNVVTDMRSNGIFVRNTRSPGIVADNIINGCGGNGIQLSYPIYNATVRDNKSFKNTGHGIHFYGVDNDVTDDEVTNANFELTTGWSDLGSPPVTERTTDFVYQGTYSWKIRTDAAGEGIYQTVSLDSHACYLAECFVYLYDDSSFSKVEMSVSGAQSNYPLLKARESAYDSAWQKLAVIFESDASVTLSIKSVIGGCHFYVDSLTLTKLNLGDGLVIKGNASWNNGSYGMRFDGCTYNSVIENNQTYGKLDYLTSSYSQIYGIRVYGELIKCTFLNNRAFGNTAYDAYIKDMLCCDISLKHISNLYWDVNATDFRGNCFPYAKTLNIRGDVYPSSTITNWGGNWNMLEQGRFLGMSANADSAFTAGIIYIFPKIGDTYHSQGSSISATINFTSTGSRTGTNRFFSGYLNDRDFKRGDRVSIHVNANVDVPDTTGLNVMLLYE